MLKKHVTMLLKSIYHSLIVFENLNGILEQETNKLIPDLNIKTIQTLSFDELKSYNKSDLLIFFRYQAVRLLLFNLVERYKSASLHLPKLKEKFKSIDTDKLEAIEPVLTHHPTEPLAFSARLILEEISAVLENKCQIDRDYMRTKFNQLLSNSLVPSKRLTPYDEIEDNQHYFKRIEAVKNRLSKDISYDVKVYARSWAGSDADGNSNITHFTMAAAAKFNEVADVRQSALIIKHTIDDLSKELKYPGTLHLGLLSDVTLRRNIIEKFEKNLFSNKLTEELKRYHLMKCHPDIFKYFIVSGTENEDDIARSLALIKLFSCDAKVIPLFETKNAIDNALFTINALFTKYPEFKEHHRNELKLMFGFSDSAKESGIFIQKIIDNAIREVQTFCNKVGVKVHIFYGTGLDIGRGGGLAHKEQTIQGNHKRFCFESTVVGEHYLLAALISQSYEKGKVIVEDVRPAVEKYRDLIFSHRQQLDKYLSFSSPFHAFVKACNYSSRPNKRDDENRENKGILDGLRAISQVNTIEGTFLNFNIWYSADLLPITENNMSMLIKAAFGIMHADIEAAKLYIKDEENLKFFLKLEAEYERVKKHLEKVKLPTELIDMLEQRRRLFDYAKNLMVVLSNELIRSGDLKSILGENESYIQEVIGTIYVAFTEYRTTPLLFINFLFDLVSKV